MSGIFISYRREDSAPYAGRLYDWLSHRFGKESIFIDIDTIQPGEDFVDVVQQKVGACDALIALIGKNWLSSLDEEGHRRLDNPDDFVHLEIVTALSRNVRVIPVLLDGARMPRAQELPEPLAKLVRRNALELSYTRFQQDMERLIEALEKAVAAAAESGKEAAEAQRREADKTEAERLTREKTETERKAREEAERVAAERALAEHSARKTAEADRIAAERAEADRKERERAATKPPDTGSEILKTVWFRRKPLLATILIFAIGTIFVMYYSRQGTSTTSTPTDRNSVVVPEKKTTLPRGLDEVLRDTKALELPRPPFGYFNSGRLAGSIQALSLEDVTQSSGVVARRVIDREDWFAKNDLVWPAYKVSRIGDHEGLGPAPANIPATYAGGPMVSAIPHRQLVFVGYGSPDYDGARYVAGVEPSAGKVKFVFDFQSYVAPPKFIAADRQFVDEKVRWASEENGVLYVSNFHRTYAKSSYGLNGYLTALDLKTGELIWRSRSLICNSENFLLHGDVIIAGYGFSAEPHFLYVLSKKDGMVLQTIPLATMAECILLKGDKLFVRTYAADRVFKFAPVPAVQHIGR